MVFNPGDEVVWFRAEPMTGRIVKIPGTVKRIGKARVTVSVTFAGHTVQRSVLASNLVLSTMMVYTP